MTIECFTNNLPVDFQGRVYDTIFRSGQKRSGPNRMVLSESKYKDT